MKYLKLICMMALISDGIAYGGAEKKAAAEAPAAPAGIDYNKEATAKMWENLNNGQAMHTLLTMKADPNARNESGLSILARATLSDSLEGVNALLLHKANPMSSVHPDSSRLPIHYASFNKRKNNIKITRLLLLSNSGSINVKDKDGNTPLMLAVLSENFEVQKHLSDAGADANIKNLRGESAFSLLAAQSKVNASADR